MISINKLDDIQFVIKDTTHFYKLTNTNKPVEDYDTVGEILAIYKSKSMDHDVKFIMTHGTTISEDSALPRIYNRLNVFNYSDNDLFDHTIISDTSEHIYRGRSDIGIIGESESKDWTFNVESLTPVGLNRLGQHVFLCTGMTMSSPDLVIKSGQTIISSSTEEIREGSVLSIGGGTSKSIRKKLDWFSGSIKDRKSF